MTRIQISASALRDSAPAVTVVDNAGLRRRWQSVTIDGPSVVVQHGQHAWIETEADVTGSV